MIVCKSLFRAAHDGRRAYWVPVCKHMGAGRVLQCMNRLCKDLAASTCLNYEFRQAQQFRELCLPAAPQRDVLRRMRSRRPAHSSIPQLHRRGGSTLGATFARAHRRPHPYSAHRDHRHDPIVAANAPDHARHALGPEKTLRPKHHARSLEGDGGASRDASASDIPPEQRTSQEVSE